MLIREMTRGQSRLNRFWPALLGNWIAPMMLASRLRPSVGDSLGAVWLGLKLISSAFWMLEERQREDPATPSLTPGYAASLVLDGLLWGVAMVLPDRLLANDGAYALAFGAIALLALWGCPPGLGRRLFLAPIMAALAAIAALQFENPGERYLALAAFVATCALFVLTRGRMPSDPPVPAAHGDTQAAAGEAFEHDAAPSLPPPPNPHSRDGEHQQLAPPTLEVLPFDLVAMTAEVYRQFRAPAIEKGLLLVLESNLGKEVWVLGDRARLSQMLGCLLENALTFTLHGCITLTVNHLGSDLVLEVSDTGVGMSDRRQHEVLDALEGEGSSPLASAFETAHGLSKVWRLAAAMRGVPSLTSHSGLGTGVSIRLPWQAASFTAMSLVPAPPQPKAGPVVLVVDDDDGCADLLMAFLQVLGVEASRVANGREAVHRFETAGARLILMDCWMPVMDGFEATRIIRAYENELDLPPVPIIAVTANAFVHERDAALAAGMTSHLAKPFSMMQLADIIETYAPNSGTASTADTDSLTPQAS